MESIPKDIEMEILHIISREETRRFLEETSEIQEPFKDEYVIKD